MYEIKSFKITKLHGFKNYNLKFKDNTLILVGENGAGKTTILRMLYYLISGQWTALAKFKFDTVSLKVGNNTFSVKSADISKKADFTSTRFLHRFPTHIRHRILEISEEYEAGVIPLSALEMFCARYDIPFHYILRELDFDDNILNSKKHNKLRKKLNDDIKDSLGGTQILYLPTYRRIEQELSTIFKGVDEDELRHRKHIMRGRKKVNFTELIEFGMRDVSQSIHNALESLKEFARKNLNSLTIGYLGDVVDKKYAELDVAQIKKTSNETIRNIIDRIDDRILSESSKRHLSDVIDNVKKDEKLSEHSKVICHYFIKLLNFQQELEKKEQKMRGFCEVCNNYMEDKVFEYTSSSFSFSISPKKGSSIINKIKLDQLSSGEKQIVSLFSHLYLSDENRYFVMIDEPELSLSVPWQRQFLVDITKGEFCSGLIAVTHSPFIYDNELDSYTHGLGEFITVEKSK